MKLQFLKKYLANTKLVILSLLALVNGCFLLYYFGINWVGLFISFLGILIFFQVEWGRKLTLFFIFSVCAFVPMMVFPVFALPNEIPWPSLSGNERILVLIGFEALLLTIALMIRMPFGTNSQK